MLINILLVAVLLGGILALYLFKKSQKPKKAKVDRPHWIMTNPLRGALISSTRSVYSTHLWRGAPRTVSYKGQEYKVLEATAINDPRASKGFSIAGHADSDVTLLVHEPVPVNPVKIAKKAREGERGIVFRITGPFTSAYITNVGSSISLKSGVKHGDSGSPIIDEDGELISLAATLAGEGPNLTRIKDILLPDPELNSD
jgi:hypothetical protein